MAMNPARGRADAAAEDEGTRALRAAGAFALALAQAERMPAAQLALLAQAAGAAGGAALYVVQPEQAVLVAQAAWTGPALPAGLALGGPGLARELRAAAQLGRPLLVRRTRLGGLLPPGWAGLALVPLPAGAAPAAEAAPAVPPPVTPDAGPQQGLPEPDVVSGGPDGGVLSEETSVIPNPAAAAAASPRSAEQQRAEPGGPDAAVRFEGTPAGPQQAAPDGGMPIAVVLVGLNAGQLRAPQHAVRLEALAAVWAAQLAPRPAVPPAPPSLPDALLHAASDAWLRLDRDGCIVTCNRAAVDLCGAACAPGQPLWRAAPAVWQALQGEGATCAPYLAVACHWDPERTLVLHAAALPEGRDLLLVDASLQRRATAALRHAHRLLADHVAARTAGLEADYALATAGFDHAPAGLALIGPDGRVLRANAALRQLFECARQDLHGLGLEALVERAGRDRVRRARARAAAGGRQDVPDLRFRRKAGTPGWCTLALARLDHGATPGALLATVWDSTAHKEAELALLRSREELRTLFRTLQDVRAGERRALAREVHDHLGQILTAVKIDLRLLAGRLGAGEPAGAALQADLDSALARVDTALRAVQDLAQMLRPPELESHGLAEALRWQLRELEERTGLRCRLECLPSYQPPGLAQARELYRIVQEALTNVQRHAQARHVWVRLRGADGRLLLRVCDDGHGLRPGAADGTHGLGVRGMHERARLLGGRVRLAGAEQRGCCVFVRVPLAGPGERLRSDEPVL